VQQEKVRGVRAALPSVDRQGQLIDEVIHFAVAGLIEIQHQLCTENKRHDSLPAKSAVGLDISLFEKIGNRFLESALLQFELSETEFGANLFSHASKF